MTDTAYSQKLIDQRHPDRSSVTSYMVQVFYDYLEKHDLPDVTLGKDEDIILLDQTPAVYENEIHLAWFRDFYAVWNFIGEPEFQKITDYYNN